MAATDVIVAIELGSEKVTGIAGNKNFDGSFQLLAVVSEPSSSFIRKGVIYNIDRTASCISGIIKKMESQFKQQTICKVYVGIGGLSMHTERNSEVRHFGVETKISQELVDSLMDSNRCVPYADMEILDVVPQEYKVGNSVLVDPVGVPTNNIEANFLNVVAKHSIKKIVENCFNQINVEIALDGLIVAPLAIAEGLLTANDRRLGCALVDLGADTTTVSVYKNGILRHLAVIPIGSYAINRDLYHQQIDEDDAEELKRRYGSACITRTSVRETSETYTLDDRCSIDAGLFEEIVEARCFEILENVAYQIDLSGYANKLMAGIVLTGGGSNIQHIEEAVRKITRIEKIRIAKEVQFEIRGALGLKKDGTNCAIAALLAKGKENCLCEKKVKTQEYEGLFTETGESAQEVREKEKQDEIRKKKEAEELARLTKECQELIDEARALTDKKEFKNALKKLREAKSRNVESLSDEIKNAENHVNEVKKQTGIFNAISDWVKRTANTITEDD